MRNWKRNVNGNCASLGSEQLGKIVFVTKSAVDNSVLPNVKIVVGSLESSSGKSGSKEFLITHKTRTVEFSKPGFGTVRQIYNTEGDREYEIFLKPVEKEEPPEPPIEPIEETGHLIVTSNVEGALIKAGESQIQVFPPGFQGRFKLDVGKHDVEVSAKGFKTRTFIVNISPGEEETLEAPLEPVPPPPIEPEPEVRTKESFKAQILKIYNALLDGLLSKATDESENFWRDKPRELDIEELMAEVRAENQDLPFLALGLVGAGPITTTSKAAFTAAAPTLSKLGAEEVLALGVRNPDDLAKIITQSSADDVANFFNSITPVDLKIKVIDVVQRLGIGATPAAAKIGISNILKNAPKALGLLLGGIFTLALIGKTVLDLGGFAGNLRKELPEPTSIATWAAIEAQDWNAAKTANAQYRKFIDISERNTEDLIKLNPFTAATFKETTNAARAAADAFDAAIAAGIAGEEEKIITLLRFEGEPTQVEIIVAGQGQTVTTPFELEVEPGKIDYIIKSPNFTDKKGTITVIRGVSATVSYVLGTEKTPEEQAAFWDERRERIAKEEQERWDEINEQVEERKRKAQAEEQAAWDKVIADNQARREQERKDDEDYFARIQAGQAAVEKEEREEQQKYWDDVFREQEERRQKRFEDELAHFQTITEELERRQEIFEEEEPEKRTVPRIDITSTPSGAKISVDGSFTGKWTPDFVLLEPGTYEVTLDKSRFKTWRGIITLEAP